MPPDPSLLGRIPVWLYVLLVLAGLIGGPYATLKVQSRTSRVSADTAKDAARDQRTERLMQDLQDERDAARAEREAMRGERDAMRAERDAQHAEHERQMQEMRQIVSGFEERQRALVEYAARLRLQVIEGKPPPPEDWPPQWTQQPHGTPSAP